MKLLIMGIVFFVLSILTWFGASHFVGKLGTTIFFWAIGIPMILVGVDRMRPEGLWTTKKKPSTKPPKGHFARTYQFDDDDKITGTPIEQWIKD